MMQFNFEDRIKLKDGWTDDKIIARLNEALESYVESDFDSEGLIYLNIYANSAKLLFYDLFEKNLPALS